jgi:hypothetical protein
MTQRDYCAHSRLSPGHVSALVKRGMPLTSIEAADAWRRQNTWSRKPPAPSASPPAPLAITERPPEAAQTDPDTGANEVSAAWGRAVKAERIAWSMLAASLKAQSPDAPRMLSLHAQACRHLADNRGRFLDLAERERQLVSGAWVKRVMTDHDGAVASLLRAMPKQLSGRIAPHDPEHCEQELDRWVQEVALATLSSTDPWR